MLHFMTGRSYKTDHARDKEILDRMPMWYRLLMQAVREHQEKGGHDTLYDEKQEVMQHG
jgi:hypothetical protein